MLQRHIVIAEITHMVAAASSAFQQLRQANVWSSRALTLSDKVEFFQCIVMSALLYSGETWAALKQHISPSAVFQMNCLQHICGVSLLDHGAKSQCTEQVQHLVC